VGTREKGEAGFASEYTTVIAESTKWMTQSRPESALGQPNW